MHFIQYFRYFVRKVFKQNYNNPKTIKQINIFSTGLTYFVFDEGNYLIKDLYNFWTAPGIIKSYPQYVRYVLKLIHKLYYINY